MAKFGRRELLALGLTAVAARAASADGTAILPKTIINRHEGKSSGDKTRVHTYANDPTHSVPTANDPTRPANPAPVYYDASRAELARLRRDMVAFRARLSADLRSLVELFVTAEQLKKIDETLALPDTDDYSFLKSMLEGLIKAKLKA
ncbi:MAG: hypothetical protein HY290_10225 [Planctomycetia bacterium]|nr:hypothetical protein [Planctomycetia bacterium]